MQETLREQLGVKQLPIFEGCFRNLDLIQAYHPRAAFYPVSNTIPQGLKSPTDYDVWLKELAPSWNLLNDWKEGKISWQQYTARYREEMQKTEAQQALEFIRTVAEELDVYLLCWETREKAGPEKCCHRFLLLEMLKEKETECGLND